MKIKLLYSKSGLPIDIPDDINVTLVHKNTMSPLSNPQRAVKGALANPVNTSSLSELAGKSKTVCILICDITRPVPNGIILPPIIETLTNSGISREDILILVATGMHRPNEGEELTDLVGSNDIINTIRIENHFAGDSDAHTYLGDTSMGIPMLIDRRFLEADLRIVTGLVEPHFMAGYSGGRKVVAPGISHQDTILGLHSADLLEHPKAANCILDDNPLHKQQMEIIRAAGNILALNVVIDEERRIGFVNFGDIESSHRGAVAFMRKHAEVKLSRRFNTIVTTSAGYPLDKTFYQTVKGMVGVIDILEPGGTIIIASECSEGIGSDDFIDALRLLDSLGIEEFLDVIKKREKAMIDEWEVEMLVKALRAGKIKLFSEGLRKEEFKHLHVEPLSSVEEGILDSVKEYNDPEIAVVPEGPYVIPMII